MTTTEIPIVQATPAPSNSEAVQVVAPLDLQEGYQLKVSNNGTEQTVTVPPGGVREGQAFTASAGKEHNIPSGGWRDGLCDCFEHGCCHAPCWLGVCCEPILAGQVMTRMSRDFLGGPGQRPSVSNTCTIVTCIFAVVFVIQAALQVVMDTETCYGLRNEWDDAAQDFVPTCPDGTTVETSTTFNIVRSVSSIVGFIFFVYMLIAICRTRQAMREKYQIQPKCCGGCEDFCCAWWCSCCTVLQMARHTNDYKTYDVGCCSNDCLNKRGQQLVVPEIV